MDLQIDRTNQIIGWFSGILLYRTVINCRNPLLSGITGAQVLSAGSPIFHHQASSLARDFRILRGDDCSVILKC